MATPERPKQNISPAASKTELSAALADIDRKLEFADGNENTIERFFRRDALLEMRDEIQAEIDTSDFP